jgi:hypothetical protein
MMMPYNEGSNNSILEALPLWEEVGELPDHRQYIFHYHTMMCPQFMNGYCPRHKASRSAPPQCFCYHFESQRRRPLVDAISGQLKYWDVLCDAVAEGEECMAGDLCPFAHTREEISYHAAKYKTKLCNDRDCRGQEVCCFAHGEEDLRNHALDCYSYWSVFGAIGTPGPRQTSPAIDLTMGQGYGMSGQGATGALYHPKVYKHRFCASYPNVSSCRRGDSCAFAHSRTEIRTALLAEDEENQRPASLSNEFFMYKFKTLWCPIGVQHDWQTCVYAHNYQDARRHPDIGYGPRPCPYWKRKETTLEYSQRCPLGVRCPFSHGAKEQLYHPSYFKTVTCQDWPNSNCPRGKLCAFWHRRAQQRSRSSLDDAFDYKLPIPEARLSDALQDDFLSPPFKLLNSLQDGEMNAYPELLAGQEQILDGIGPVMMGGGMCDLSFGQWGSQSEMPAICNFVGSPASASTTAADSDEAASADSSLGSDKSQALTSQEDDCGALMMLPPNGEIQWQNGSPMWGAPPPWSNESCMPPPASMSPHLGPQMPSTIGSPAMGPGTLPPNAMPNGIGFGCGSMASGMHQQMVFYSVQQQDVMGNAPPYSQPAQHSGDPMMMLPPPQMPAELGSQHFPGFGEAPMMSQTCAFYGHTGAPMMDFGGGYAAPSMMRPPMTIEELPLEAYQAIGDQGKQQCLTDSSVSPSEFFPANGKFRSEEALRKPSGEEAMPTCNGFIHFKETDPADADVTPTGRPRAMSH